jgi:hypothetical protein
MGILAVALVASLAACSDDPDSDPPAGGESESTSDAPDDPLTQASVDCPEFEEVAQRIVTAQTALYSGQGDAEGAIEDLQSQLEDLKEGAPVEVEQALTDMSEAFGEAAEILRDATPDQTELLELAPELSAAGQTITEYITEQCG